MDPASADLLQFLYWTLVAVLLDESSGHEAGDEDLHTLGSVTVTHFAAYFAIVTISTLAIAGCGCRRWRTRMGSRVHHRVCGGD